MLNHNYFLLCLFLLTSSCYRTDHSFPVKGLEFEAEKSKKLAGWMMDITLPMAGCWDSSSVRNGKHPLRIGQVRIGNGSALALNASLKQTLLVPRQTGADSLAVALTCKTQGLETSRLIVVGMDDRERILYSDTVPISREADWSDYRKTIPLKGAAALNLQIEAWGPGELSEQNLWLDKLDLTVGGKDIRKYPAPEPEESWLLPEAAVVPLGDCLYEKMAAWNKKKIVALGESVHGCEDFAPLIIDIIKHRIEHQRCRLVLMEIPLARMLYVNRYVRGDDGFSADSIRTAFQFDLYSRHFLDFFNWLRAYNAGREDKVWLLGTDSDRFPLATLLDVYDYIRGINRTHPASELQQFGSQLLAGGKEKEAEMIDRLARSSVVSRLLGEKEAELVKYCLETSKRLGNRSAVRTRLRDSVMGKQIEFLTGLLCRNSETVTVYTHLGHANYLSVNSTSLFEPACGNYLKRIYGSAYACVGLYVGEGAFLTNSVDSASLTVDTLLKAPAYSLEALLEKAKSDCFYVASADLPERILPARHIGNTNWEDQFLPVSAPARMDGLIFIRSGSACRIPEKLLNRRVNSWINLLLRYQNRLENSM